MSPYRVAALTLTPPPVVRTRWTVAMRGQSRFWLVNFAVAAFCFAVAACGERSFVLSGMANAMAAVLGFRRCVRRVPVENGIPWRRSVVHVVCPWRQSAREWAGGRWALTQRSDTVRWQNTVWTSGEWTAVDACPHADRSKRPYGMEPEDWVPCDCEVWP